ncbi:MAG: UDP-N-acetylmuramoyl-L-alanine--D-glutamate ligase [Planctomycetota bacterium]|nr:UDP-N-acetylmuramoyl-L-alanine--D-glutamate ligase [Planctomycetota bacterium]
MSADDDRASTAGRRALVMGLGRFGGGAGAARHLARRGFDVTVTDLSPPHELAASLEVLDEVNVRLSLGGHRRADFERADLVVANPAVSPSSPWLAVAREHGARITSEIELLLEALPARTVCVTGTQGKSSTCSMTAAFLAAAGFRAHLGGNLGGSLLDELPRIAATDVVVLELSSYQLAALADPGALPTRVEAVAVTNVLADHLERHGTPAAYAAAKGRILDLLVEGGVAILPGADGKLAAWTPKRGARVDFWPEGRFGPGLFLREGLFRHDEVALGRVEDLAVPGRFQRENALVALGLAHAIGARPTDLERAVGAARGLEHRVEDLGLFRGRRVVDNGVSTTPDSTLAALECVPAGSTLIAGGRSKGLPLDELAAHAARRAALAVTFGEAAAELAAAFRAAGLEALQTITLDEAVAEAFERTPAGGTVLFSPACASFDAYANFRERAQAFRAALPHD